MPAPAAVNATVGQELEARKTALPVPLVREVSLAMLELSKRREGADLRKRLVFNDPLPASFCCCSISSD